jgi:UDP-N-acetylglucosamine:LPS N-acetylglucosamine transferase
VPLPSGKGYQARNADDLVKAGGGIVIAQDRTEEIIATSIDLLTDDVKRKSMAETAIASKHGDVARTIADHILDVGRED